MFSGTIRGNLDVTGDTYTDEQLWAVLSQVNLKHSVEVMEGKLGHVVMEQGSNLSAGTVQLICLARVLLKKPKLLFMDEATASVDLATDTLVQKTIRTAFAASTIITIAHRLNTVIDFDKICVMDSAQIAEFGPPAELLVNKSSLFSQLVDSTGKGSAAELRSRATAASAAT
jgi:ABC-type multidrug transport system fused ATPase/permease subunit